MRHKWLKYCVHGHTINIGKGQGSNTSSVVPESTFLVIALWFIMILKLEHKLDWWFFSVLEKFHPSIFKYCFFLYFFHFFFLNPIKHPRISHFTYSQQHSLISMVIIPSLCRWESWGTKRLVCFYLFLHALFLIFLTYLPIV